MSRALRFLGMTAAVAIAMAASAAIFLANEGKLDFLGLGTKETRPAAKGPAAAPRLWAATAPGRVEPKGGDIRISPAAAGRIAEVRAATNDAVVAGDLLIALEEDDALARLAAAEAEAGARKRERDAESVNRLATDRRQAEDALAAAERQLFSARRDLDRLMQNARTTPPAADALSRARALVKESNEKVEQERTNLRRLQATSGMPAATRLEAALVAARADISAAEAALERMRIRAPADGTILQITAKPGETLAPSPEQIIVVLGDLSALQVRAEVDERDAGRVRVGQPVVVRSDAYPGRDFTGRVGRIARALGPQRVGPKAPRKPTDIDVLEVLVDLEGTPPLLPGMRVDVYFRNAEQTSETPRPTGRGT